MLCEEVKYAYYRIIAVLAVFTWLDVQLVKVSAVIMNFVAILVGLGTLCILWYGSTVQGNAGLFAIFLLSPFGLPMLSIILLGLVQRFRYWIQDTVYG